MKYTELLPAYEWTCEGCGSLNFSRSVPTFIKDLPEEIREQMYDPLQPFEDGEMVLSTPVEVTCKECKAAYKTYMECSPLFEETGPPPDDEPDE